MSLEKVTSDIESLVEPLPRHMIITQSTDENIPIAGTIKGIILYSYPSYPDI